MVRITRLPSQLQKRLFYIFIWLLAAYALFIFFRTLRESVLLDKLDRLNVVIYGQEAELISFGLSDKVHYIISFSHADKVSVPGGYGRYNVGALGKLAQIEKDHHLIARTFSSMASAHVDYYILPKKPDVYDALDTETPSFSSQAIIKMLFSSSYSTNANLFDRLYLSFLLSQRREKDFIVLRSLADKGEHGEMNFSERRFLKKYKGFFYHQSLRFDAQEVQITYSSYPAAVSLSRVIEGQGIRVVDLAESGTQDDQENCTITYKTSGQTKTVHYLQRTFGCEVKKGDIGIADIQMVMGRKLTELWK